MPALQLDEGLPIHLLYAVQRVILVQPHQDQIVEEFLTRLAIPWRIQAIEHARRRARDRLDVITPALVALRIEVLQMGEIVRSGSLELSRYASTA